MSRYQEDRQQNMGQKWKLPPNGQPISLFSGNVTGSRTVIRPDDDSESQLFIIINCHESLVAYVYPFTKSHFVSQSFSVFTVPTIPFVHYASPSSQLLK
jgi:hypothetical protein